MKIGSTRCHDYIWYQFRSTNKTIRSTSTYHNALTVVQLTTNNYDRLSKPNVIRFLAGPLGIPAVAAMGVQNLRVEL